MLCCVGLIGGMAVGQSLGGPWTYIAPAAGFGIGLVGDLKFMKGMHSHGPKRDKVVPAEREPGPHSEVVTDPGAQVRQAGR